MNLEELLEKIASLSREKDKLEAELEDLKKQLLHVMLADNVATVKNGNSLAKIVKNPPIYEVEDLDAMREKYLEYSEFTPSGLRRLAREKPYEMLKCIEKGYVRVRPSNPYKLYIRVG